MLIEEMAKKGIELFNADMLATKSAPWGFAEELFLRRMSLLNSNTVLNLLRRPIPNSEPAVVEPFDFIRCYFDDLVEVSDGATPLKFNYGFWGTHLCFVSGTDSIAFGDNTDCAAPLWVNRASHPKDFLVRQIVSSVHNRHDDSSRVFNIRLD